VEDSGLDGDSSGIEEPMARNCPPTLEFIFLA
jgi:hypothetical protein